MKAQRTTQHAGQRHREAPSIRNHASAAIRPDVHERFQKVLAKVDAEIAAQATQQEGRPFHVGVHTSSGRRRLPLPTPDDPAVDDLDNI